MFSSRRFGSLVQFTTKLASASEAALIMMLFTGLDLHAGRQRALLSQSIATHNFVSASLCTR